MLNAKSGKGIILWGNSPIHEGVSSLSDNVIREALKSAKLSTSVLGRNTQDIPITDERNPKIESYNADQSYIDRKSKEMLIVEVLMSQSYEKMTKEKMDIYWHGNKSIQRILLFSVREDTTWKSKHSKGKEIERNLSASKIDQYVEGPPFGPLVLGEVTLVHKIKEVFVELWGRNRTSCFHPVGERQVSTHLVCFNYQAVQKLRFSI